MVQRILTALTTELRTSVGKAATLSWLHSGRAFVHLRRFPLPDAVFDSQPSRTLEVIAAAACEDPGQLQAAPAGFVGIAFRRTAETGEGGEEECVWAVDRSGRRYRAVRLASGAVEARLVTEAQPTVVASDPDAAVLRSLSELSAVVLGMDIPASP